MQPGAITAFSLWPPTTRAASWDATLNARGLLGFHHAFQPEDRGAIDDFNLEEVRQLVAPLHLGVRIFLTAASLINSSIVNTGGSINAGTPVYASIEVLTPGGNRLTYTDAATSVTVTPM